MLSSPTYWLNQLDQFDPKMYQTEQQYYNVFEGAFPKTWGKVKPPIKDMISEFYNAYGETGSEDTRKQFDSKYKTDPSMAVPHKEDPSQTKAAVQDAVTEVQVGRGEIQQTPAVPSFALASLGDSKKQNQARRQKDLMADLDGAKGEAAKQKAEFESAGPEGKLENTLYEEEQRGARTTKESVSKGGAKANPDEAADTRQNLGSKTAAFLFADRNIQIISMILDGVGRGDHKIKEYGLLEQMRERYAQEYNKIVGEPGAYRKNRDIEDKDGRRQARLAKERPSDRVMERLVFAISNEGSNGRLQKYDYTKGVSQMIKRSWLGLTDKYGTESIFNPSGETQDSIMEELDEAFKYSDAGQTEDTHTPEDAIQAERPITTEQGEVMTEDPDRAQFSKKAKMVQKIAGHTFEDPLSSLRPDSGIPGGEKVIPTSQAQRLSDVMFDMFSVVPPGFGNGETNKMFLQQNSWEQFVKHGGNMYGPNAHHGPTAGIHPMPMAWRSVKPQRYIDQQQSTRTRLYDRASDVIRRHAVTEATARALPNDFGPRTSMSDKKLLRSSNSVFVPVIHNRATFVPVFDKPAFQRKEKRRKLYDPVRHPDAVSRDPEGIGQHLPYGLAFGEILR